MGKKVLAAILGFCIIALAGVDVYLYVTLAQSDKVQVYSGKQAGADGKEKSKQESGGDISGIVTTSMKGFTSGVQSDSDNKTDNKDTGKNDTKKNGVSNADYILPDSDSKYYKTMHLKKLTRQEVKLARNEIYARHGRKFTKDMSVKEYFEGKDWYYPTVDEVPDSELNKYEIANRDLIVAYEQKKKWR